MKIIFFDETLLLAYFYPLIKEHGSIFREMKKMGRREKIACACAIAL
jgi:hypothetical protein